MPYAARGRSAVVAMRFRQFVIAAERIDPMDVPRGIGRSGSRMLITRLTFAGFGALPAPAIWARPPHVDRRAAAAGQCTLGRRCGAACQRLMGASTWIWSPVTTGSCR